MTHSARQRRVAVTVYTDSIKTSPYTQTHGPSRNRRAAGFTLVETLVVAAVIVMLLAILLPSLKLAKRKARITQAHSDLRQITMALDTYAMYNKDKFPPMRTGCMKDQDYQLPVELSKQRYLPKSRSKVPQAAMMDVFSPKETYKYRTPGPQYYNGTFWYKPRHKHLWGTIWVPDDFPRCASEEGEFYRNGPDEERSPVDYAVWSVGPDPKSPKFPRHEGTDDIDDSRFPLQRKCWLLGAGDGPSRIDPDDGCVLRPGPGLITHFRDKRGLVDMSP